MNIEQTIGDYTSFLKKLFGNLKVAGFAIDELQELDHIAYRTESLKTYKIVKTQLLGFCESYSDKEFVGRPVLVCRLKKPLVYEEFKIEAIEVLAPKENNPFKNGLEHAEFVTKSELETFREKHKEIDFNLKAYDREINPELTIEFDDCAAKFHTQSLLSVRDI